MVKFLLMVSDDGLLVVSTSKTSVTLSLTIPVMSVLSATTTILRTAIFTLGTLGLAGRPILK